MKFQQGLYNWPPRCWNGRRNRRPGGGDQHGARVPDRASANLSDPNRARLAAALAARTPAAARFKDTVDQWVAGADLWGFESWDAALLGQLTGNVTYCTKAVADIESQVVAAEALIARNRAPAVASDSYLDIGDMIGGLALVYDWCNPQTTAVQRARWLKYADQAVWNVWHFASAKWGTATIPWTGWATD